MSFEDSTARTSMEDLDAYTTNPGAILQAEVVVSNVRRNQNGREDERPKEGEELYKIETQMSLDEKDTTDNSSSRLFLVLYTILLLSIVFLVVALTRYIRVKRSVVPIPVSQDAASAELLSPVEAADPDRDPVTYRSHIEEILVRELHDECSTNFLEGPQKMAIDWLVYEDVVLNSTQIGNMAVGYDLEPAFPLVQRYALMVLFFATSGELWSGAPWNLMVDIPECRFMGIECDMDGRVLLMDLGFRKLRGRLPEEVGMLINLRSFSVLSNSLEGTIPSFLYNRLTNLDVLELSKNEFSSSLSSDISRLSNLKILHLAELSLTGQIPVDAMKQLTSLEQIVITYATKMKGPLLELSENWPNLNVVDIYMSGFDGSIPTTIGQNTNLEMLWLDAVPMDASTIPTEIGLLKNLRGFVFRPSRNGVGGATIPTEIGECTNLDTVDWNNLSGFIPTEIGKLTKLKEVIFEDGTISGSIPSEIGLLSKLTLLSILGNQLKGTLPSELGTLSNLEVLDVYANNLTGNVPSGVCENNMDIFIDRDCSIEECECCDKCRGERRY